MSDVLWFLGLGGYIVAAGYTAYKVAYHESNQSNQVEPEQDEWVLGVIIGVIWPLLWLCLLIYGIGWYFALRYRERKGDRASR